MPKLSIITINYNNNSGLQRTVGSVLPQLNPDIEYIIIDGGSSDGSAETVNSLKDRLAYSCSEKDKGIYNAMNKGVDHATGEYLLFLNSGDYLHSPDVLAKVLPQLHGEDIIYGDLVYIDPATKKERIDINPDVINADKLLTGSLPHPASFIKRQLLVDTPYNENLKIVADWEFFVKKILWEGSSTRHLNLIISDFIEDGISCQSNSIHDRERQEGIKRLFTPAIISVCEQWRSMSKIYATPELMAIGNTRKLYKRIRPLLRFIITVNSMFSSKRSV